MKAIAVALCLSVSIAQAAVIAEAQEGGIRLELHDQAGHCTDNARLALYHNDKQVTTGCWRIAQGMIQVAWSDATISQLPARVFKPVNGT